MGAHEECMVRLRAGTDVLARVADQLQTAKDVLVSCFQDNKELLARAHECRYVIG